MTGSFTFQGSWHVEETFLVLSLWFDELTTPSETEGPKEGFHSAIHIADDHEACQPNYRLYRNYIIGYEKDEDLT